MNKRRNQAVALFVIIVFLMALLSGCGAAKPEQGIHADNSLLAVKVLDVGQGDAILIKTPEQVILVDTGDVAARDKLVAYIKKQGITVIDKVIITHPHADHLGGMAAVMDNFTVKQIYDSGQTTTTSLYAQYLAAVKKKKIPFKVVSAGEIIDAGNGAALKVLAPEKPYFSGTDSDLNNNSVVIKLTCGNFSVLLAGDIEREAEERLLQKHQADLKSDILKSPHHGSRTSSTLPFLKAVGADTVVISLGENNDYNHPHKSTLKKYNDLKMKIYRTDTNGTVAFYSDGKTYRVVKEKD